MATILIRRISHYEGADVLLGVFSSREEAERQRTAYIAARLATPLTDPWHQQQYKDDGLNPSEVMVLEIDGATATAGATVFVLSSYTEGFGQLTGDFIAVYADLLVAKKEAARIEKAEIDSDFPIECRVQEAVVGNLMSDAPAAQPRSLDD